jgi:hypothetical protein
LTGAPPAARRDGDRAARRQRWHAGLGALLCTCLLAPSPARADQLDMDLASKIILKVMMLDRDIHRKTGGEIVVGVIGSRSAARSFQALKGEPIDRHSLIHVVEVIEYDKLPPVSKAPTFLFAGADADPHEVMRYTREKHLLSVTTVAEHVIKGITLGIGVEENRPRILLNLTGSKAEQMSWDPKILKISRTVE